MEDAATKANSLLDPYTGLGTNAVNALTLGMDKYTKAPTMADLQIDPGFAFRLQQGQQALERSAAARGGALGGAALKSTERYSQGVASDEYAKAFDRYRATQSDSFSRLSNLLGVGQSAANTEGSNLLNSSQYAGTARLGGAEYAGTAGINATNLTSQNTIDAAKTSGDYLTQAANATAAGKIGSANAISGAITGGANAAGSGAINALVLSKLFPK